MDDYVDTPEYKAFVATMNSVVEALVASDDPDAVAIVGLDQK